jgi:hypothetical protein
MQKEVGPTSGLMDGACYELNLGPNHFMSRIHFIYVIGHFLFPTWFRNLILFLLG